MKSSQKVFALTSSNQKARDDGPKDTKHTERCDDWHGLQET